MMWPATDVDGGHESAVPFGCVGEVAVLTSMLDATVADHVSALLLRGKKHAMPAHKAGREAEASRRKTRNQGMAAPTPAEPVRLPEGRS